VSHETAGTVLVLDPAGPQVHSEVPATWRELRESRQVVWQNRGEDGFWGGARAYLDGAAGPVDIVAAGPAVAAAMALGQEHPEVVRSLLLVDPAAGEQNVGRADARAADEQWQRNEAARIKALNSEGVRVRVVAHSWDGNDDRREPPLPLGHPIVVATVRASLDGGRLDLEELLAKPSTWQMLDKPAEIVQERINTILPAGAVRDLLLGKPVGHPLHPALVHVPIGMYTAAAIFDFLPGHRGSTGVLIGLGVLSSVPAAMAGAAEYTNADKTQRRTGLVHAALNGVGLVCYVMSLWHRVRGRQLQAKATAMAGFALTGASGALGGYLAYRQGMGVDSAAGS
jgi:uncharacterized membrane protein